MAQATPIASYRDRDCHDTSCFYDWEPIQTTTKILKYAELLIQLNSLIRTEGLVLKNLDMLEILKTLCLVQQSFQCPAQDIYNCLFIFLDHSKNLYVYSKSLLLLNYY